MTLFAGEPFPTFRLPGTTNPNYAVDAAGGPYIVFAVLSAADDATIGQGVETIQAHRHRFDDLHACVFGIVPDRPEWRARCEDQIPGVRWLFDADGAVAGLLEAVDQPAWILVDPNLTVLRKGGSKHADSLLANVSSLPPPHLHTGTDSFAPVLLVPRILEPAFCEELIAEYDRIGGEPSGFMREVDGITRLMNDVNHKRRCDTYLEEGRLKDQARVRIQRRLVPQIHKAFQFTVTRMERYLVACYDAEPGGYFRPHRDNTTKGTAHRRFAVSINLNKDFDGGDLRFPEYGARTYRPPLGGAVVFSCSLLHEATAVTRGRRYAFLPFLYDDAAAEVRRQNLKYLDPELMAEATEPTAQSET